MRNPFLNVVAFSFSAISHMSTYISIYIHKYENGTIQENVKKTTRLTGRPSAVTVLRGACQMTIPVMLFVAYKNINKYKLHKSNLFFYCHAHK